MPGYATFADVQARAGRFQAVFTVAGKKPDQADIEAILADLDDQVDLALRARGYNPDTIDAEVKNSLADVVAYGALARALAAVPSSTDELAELRKYAMKVWGLAMGDPTANSDPARRGAIANGTFPAIAALEAGAKGGGQTAGSFWGDEPDYGTDAQINAEANALTEETAPYFQRGMPL